MLSTIDMPTRTPTIKSNSVSCGKKRSIRSARARLIIPIGNIKSLRNTAIVITYFSTVKLKEIQTYAINCVGMWFIGPARKLA